MQDLIERLEKATEPDRELDCAIYVWLGATPPEGESLYWTAPGGLNRHYESLIPHYTSSIDAGLTLVPDGFRWKLGYSRYVPCVAEVNDYREPEKFILIGRFDGECDSSHAIALCIASLKAREAMQHKAAA